MWKDGHLVSEHQQYLRIRKQGTGTPEIYIHNGGWQIEGANENWNRCAQVALNLTTDIFDNDQDTLALIRELCEKHAGLDYMG